MNRPLMLVGIDSPRLVLRLPVEGRPYLLGRSSRCDFVVDNMSVSRRHAELVTSAARIEVIDLGSRNGTFVDDMRVQTTALAIGQRLRFGSAEFCVDTDSTAT